MLPALSTFSRPPGDAASSRTPLRFRDDGTFRILQIADVHMGEPFPQQDVETFAGLELITTLETVDIAVLSGDQLTGLNIDTNATAHWDKLTSLLDRRSIPHTAILGNHDAEPYNQPGNQSLPGAKTSRTALMRHDAALPRSYSSLGPEELWPAASVYVVNVLPPAGTAASSAAAADELPAVQLFHLDSGGGGMPEALAAAQVAWFNATIAASRAKAQRRRGNGTAAAPALVFVHIPVAEFAQAWTAQRHCFGDKQDDISPMLADHGLFAALDAAPEVRAVFIGHNHCNDFCCRYGARNVSLCFGRHSGFGGYGCKGYRQGSRVIELSRDSASGAVSIRTHVRLVDGDSFHAGEL